MFDKADERVKQFWRFPIECRYSLGVIKGAANDRTTFCGYSLSGPIGDQLILSNQLIAGHHAGTGP